MVCWRVWDYAKGGENTFLVSRMPNYRLLLEMIACSREFCPLLLQNEPTGLEIIMIVLNLAACVPVLLCVSIFSLYHYWSLWSNTTTYVHPCCLARVPDRRR